MFSRIRKRFTYANVAMTLALVLAMTGGAYAAGKFVITSTKQISPKVVSALKGKAGPAGPAGSKGDPGPAGKEGAPGKEGSPGKEGPPGKEGEEGSPGTKGATGPPGSVGSTGVKGSTGASGPEGSPWTAGVLPSGKTETGTWGVAALPASFFGGLSEYAIASISFTIPLKAGSSVIKAQVIAPGGKGAGGGTCPTTSSLAKPEAEPGNLCVFEGNAELNVSGSLLVVNPETNKNGEAGKTGALVHLEPNTKKESLDAHGTWAVTAE
jgi:hypothetical protein